MHLEACDLEYAAGAVELDGADDGRVDLYQQQAEKGERNQCAPLGEPAEYLESYIPLYAVYDFKNKEYAYVFDDRYFIGSSKDKIYKDGVVNLNLFEMKVKDESTYNDDEKIAMSRKQQLKAVIDMNPNQFEIENPICRQ